MIQAKVVRPSVSILQGPPRTRCVAFLEVTSSDPPVLILASGYASACIRPRQPCKRSFFGCCYNIPTRSRCRFMDCMIWGWTIGLKVRLNCQADWVR